MTTASRNFEEKRNFIRMKVAAPVHITMGDQQLHGKCKDLSANGLQILLDQAITVGTEAEVLIEQDGENRIPFKATVEVARSEELSEGEYLVGLSIKAIHD